MARKMFGVFTAVAAALLLVGVAWASGDRASDDSNSGSFASSGSLAGSGSVTSVSSPSVSSQVTNTSLDDNGGTTGTSVDSPPTSSSVDSASTSSTVDNSSTSTTIDDRGGTTNTTIDDHDDEDETRSPAPVDSDPTSYQVGGAGTVTVQIVTGQLVLLDVTATKGWSFEVDKSGGRDIKIEFESGESEAEFEAKLRDGQIRIEVEAKDG